MKKKMRILNVPNPLFKVETIFAWNCSFQELSKFLEKKYNVVDLNYEYFKNADGTVLNLDGPPHRVIWCEKLNKTPYWIGIAAHEITHHVLRICDDKGIPLTIERNADETIAYMVDYYMKELFENI